MPQSCSMKNGKYTEYSRIFHTFAWVKISRRISLPHYAVLPKKYLRIAGIDFAVPTLLFTSLFTIVLSINETNQNYQFRSVGTYAHGSFKDVDKAQITL